MERLLTVRDVAALLSVSRPTIYRYVNEHELPHVRLSGGVLRFREREVEFWVDEHVVSVAGASRMTLEG